MHFENFYDYKMRSLTLKLSFVGDVKKRNEDRLGLKSQPQGKDKEKVKEGKRTSTTVRTGKKASTYRSSECHPV